VTGAVQRHIVTVILITLCDLTNRRVLDLDRSPAWVSNLLALGRDHDADRTTARQDGGTIRATM